MAIVEPECTGREIPSAVFTTIYPEFSIEVANLVKSFFDEAWLAFAIEVWTFCWDEVHSVLVSKSCDLVSDQLTIRRTIFGRNPLLAWRISEDLGEV